MFPRFEDAIFLLFWLKSSVPCALCIGALHQRPWCFAPTSIRPTSAFFAMASSSLSLADKMLALQIQLDQIKASMAAEAAPQDMQGKIATFEERLRRGRTPPRMI